MVSNSLYQRPNPTSPLKSRYLKFHYTLMPNTVRFASALRVMPCYPYHHIEYKNNNKYSREARTRPTTPDE